MKAWFENDIQRLEREKDELEALNVSFNIDEEALKEKLLKIHLRISGVNENFDLPDKLKDIDLIAVFPDTYPYFRATVYADNICLPRHQNPLDKGLCLLGRPTDLWNPDMTLGQFLQQQLKKVLVQGYKTDENELGNDETEQAEPISEYFGSDVAVIFDSSIIESNALSGKVELAGKITVGIPNDETEGLRYAVLEIKDKDGNKILSSLPNSVENMFPKKVQGVIYKIPKLLPFENPGDLYEWLNKELAKQNDKIHFRSEQKIRRTGQIVKNIIALNFPEETSAGKEEMIGWLFLIVGDFYKPIKEGAPKTRHHFWQYAKASRISGSDIILRIPKLKPLEDKSVAIIGLGSLGAHSAIEFARNGVQKIWLIDYDTVNAATTVRWPLGISAAEKKKTEVIKDFIETNYPFTDVDFLNSKIGQIRATGKTPLGNILPFELPSIDEMLSDVSLVYDATAEVGVSHYFAEECKKRKIPFVSVWATQGALGGQILRVLPGKTEGCWMCSMWHRYKNENQEHANIKAPPFESDAEIQARGCGDITFTGAGFDLQNIVNSGVRLAVSTLCEGVENSYPSFDWDIGVLSLVDDNGNAILPQWKNYKLEKHPNCPYCANK
jgi:hypothetical protein